MGQRESPSGEKLALGRSGDTCDRVDLTDNAGGTLADSVAPPDPYMAYLVDSIFMPGTTAPLSGQHSGRKELIKSPPAPGWRRRFRC